MLFGTLKDIFWLLMFLSISISFKEYQYRYIDMLSTYRIYWYFLKLKKSKLRTTDFCCYCIKPLTLQNLINVKQFIKT